MREWDRGTRRSTVLTPIEEAMIVAFRQRTLPPLDGIMGCLRDSIPKLTRSSLHRCLAHHGFSQLPASETKSKCGRFAEATIGYVHIDSCKLRHADGKIHIFVAIDRISKFIFVESYEKAGKMNAAAFLEQAVEAFLYKICTVLTDNGIAFADLPKNRTGPNCVFVGLHIFSRTCLENGITRKLTKPYHPWTNGQAERMNRTIKDATIKAFHCPDIESLKAHVLASVKTYNSAKNLSELRWKTPFEAIAYAWTTAPSILKIDPLHHMLRLNS